VEISKQDASWPGRLFGFRRLGYVVLVGGLLTLSGGFFVSQGAILDGSGEDGRNAVSAWPSPTPTVAAAALSPTPTLEPLPPAAPVEEEAPPAPEPPPTQAPAPPPPTSTPVPPPPTTEAPPPTQAPPAPAPTATTAPPPPPPPPPPTPTPVPAPPPAPVSLTAMEQQMFVAHNTERAAAGVAALQADARLVEIARRRAEDMAARNYFSHTSPTGETAFSLMGQIGYVYGIAGENIARNNYPDSQSVSVAMSGFMNSAGHRQNILDGRFNRVGIGMAVGADGMKYFAVVFAGP
jgi:uncharacterized protein YkwD